MMSIRTAALLCVLYILLTGPVSGHTQIVCGDMTVYEDGYDVYAGYIYDAGGGMKCVVVQTWLYPDVDMDPMYQDIDNVTYTYNPPDIYMETNYTDEDGNNYRYSWWGDPYGDCVMGPGSWWADITFWATTKITLDGMTDLTSFPIPMGSIPPEVERYLEPGTYTQSDAPEIIAHANSLVGGCLYEHEAVTAVIDWCLDNMEYEDPPPNVDALAILQDPLHQSTCVGYSHLPIALLRAVGIPARFVGGVVLAGDYLYYPCFIRSKDNNGFHSWMEVYYPEEGCWVPYDAQAYYHYTDVLAYRMVIGKDVENRDATYFLADYCLPPPQGYKIAQANSSVLSEFSDLYCLGTLATPNGSALADRIGATTGAPRSDDKLKHHVEFRAEPNPCTKVTRFSYSLGAVGSVRLGIYSASGRLVSQHHWDEVDPGVHSFEWRSVDDRGAPVSPGVYFCVLDTPQNTQRIKVVVLH